MNKGHRSHPRPKYKALRGTHNEIHPQSITTIEQGVLPNLNIPTLANDKEAQCTLEGVSVSHRHALRHDNLGLELSRLQEFPDSSLN